MSVISLPASALSACGSIRFELVRVQSLLTTLSGVSQVTSFADKRWSAQLSVNPQFESQLRAWSLAIDQLSDLGNVLALTPPYYEGPSTGYSGAGPLVNGASQTGLSLAVDGVSPSTAILSAGDFISFDVTSPLGNSNRQLIKAAANVTSNGSGQATIQLVTPIRQSPADNAAVNISTPSAYFGFSSPKSTVDYQPGKYSAFVLDLIERIYP